jgi:thymidylate kinase
MIIILEGVNGVGKSTYATLLSAKLRLPIIRPFRINHTTHTGNDSKYELELKKYGVKPNTHIDDLYVADLLRQLQSGAILDRAIPSAIAYAKMRGESFPPKDKYKNLLAFWEGMIQSISQPLLYVWMRAEYDDARERAGARWPLNKAKFNSLETTFDQAFKTLHIPKKQINTSTVDVSEGIKIICQASQK